MIHFTPVKASDYIRLCSHASGSGDARAVFYCPLFRDTRRGNNQHIVDLVMPVENTAVDRWLVCGTGATCDWFFSTN